MNVGPLAYVQIILMTLSMIIVIFCIIENQDYAEDIDFQMP